MLPRTVKVSSGNTKCCFEPKHPRRCLIKWSILCSRWVRSVISSNSVDCPVNEPYLHRLDICDRSKWWIHFVTGVKRRKVLIIQTDVVRGGFCCHWQPLRLRCPH